MPKAKRRSSSAGQETKARILDATLETLGRAGIVGTSARAIATTGDFNQALIFYHFGSVDDAIVGAIDRMSARRLEMHREAVAEASTLVDLVRIARELHEADARDNAMTILTQAFAGGAGDPEMGPKLYDALDGWSEMVADAIRRVIGDHPAAGAVPADLMGRTISALFLGVELLDNLDPERADAAGLLASLEGAAIALQGLLASD